MQIIKVKNYQELSQKVAEIVKNHIQLKSNLVLGLPTGSTPILMYKLLVKMNKKGEINFSQVITFNLDEYFGLSANNIQSYHYFMDKNLFSKINIKKENIHLLDGKTKNPQTECDKYEQEINEAGGIDLQILSIGHNGHVAFNEPGSPFNSKTRLVNLDRETKINNGRYFDSAGKMPNQALTMGIATIMSAQEIILMATKNKKEIIEKTLKNMVTEQIPATILKQHPNCTLIIEQE